MQIDGDRLVAYLRRHLPELNTSRFSPAEAGMRPATHTVLRQFAHGQSNPTYYVQVDYEHELVVRKKPV